MTLDNRKNQAAAACAFGAVAVLSSSNLSLPPPPNLANAAIPVPEPTLVGQVAQRLATAEFGPPLQAPEIPAPCRQDSQKISNAAQSVVKVNLDGSLGSGFIIKYKDSYYVVTNAHVVKQSRPEEIDITLPDGKVVLVDKVSSYPPADIAIIRLKGNGDYPTANLGDSAKIAAGDRVFAIGFPLGGFHQVTTSGSVSGVNLDAAVLGEPTIFPPIQTDTQVNPGNSGGPLLNRDGEVVGIVFMGLKAKNLLQNPSFAIPINEIKPVIEQLIENGFAVHGYIGAHIITPTRSVVSDATTPVEDGTEPLVPLWVREARRQFGEHSALVFRVEPNSPASRSGIKPGDLIIGINGRKIEGDGDARAHIAQTRPGEDVIVDLVRKDPDSEKFFKIRRFVRVENRPPARRSTFLASIPPLPNLASH